MAGSDTAPGAVNNTHIPNFSQTMLVGPLSAILSLEPDLAIPRMGIKAIWRNEVGDAT